MKRSPALQYLFYLEQIGVRVRARFLSANGELVCLGGWADGWTEEGRRRTARG